MAATGQDLQQQLEQGQARTLELQAAIARIKAENQRRQQVLREKGVPVPDWSGLTAPQVQAARAEARRQYEQETMEYKLAQAEVLSVGKVLRQLEEERARLAAAVAKQREDLRVLKDRASDSARAGLHSDILRLKGELQKYNSKKEQLVQSEKERQKLLQQVAKKQALQQQLQMLEKQKEGKQKENLAQPKCDDE